VGRRPAPQWVDELFSAVPCGRGPRPRYGAAGLPFAGGRLYVLPAVRDDHRLTATFQLPSLEALYRKKADEYLAHLVGHEGSGSLLSALKARGWASELSAGVSEQSSVAWLFEVSITLTEAGLAAGPGEQGGESGSRSWRARSQRAAALAGQTTPAPHPPHLLRLPFPTQAAVWRARACCLSSWRCCGGRGRSAGRTTSWPPSPRCASASRCGGAARPADCAPAGRVSPAR
jgi:hypothetical protein